MFLYISLKCVQPISYIVYLLPLFLSSSANLGQFCAVSRSQCLAAFVHVRVRYVYSKEDKIVHLILG